MLPVSNKKNQQKPIFSPEYFCCCGCITRGFHICFSPVLNMSNLSFCSFGIVHISHSGHKWIKIRDWSLKSAYIKDRQFYKNIAMERSNRKKFIHIDRETWRYDLFAMHDKIKNETDSDTEDRLEDSARNK